MNRMCGVYEEARGVRRGVWCRKRYVERQMELPREIRKMSICLF